MAKLIPAAERIIRARKLIQKARDLPAPADPSADGLLTYTAEVRDLLRQARDMVKLIPYSPSATPEMKKEVDQILEDANQAARTLRG